MNPIRSIHDLRREVPDEAAARALFERLVWPSGPHCPCCGSLKVWRFRAEGRRSRDGLLQCADPECGHQFTVTSRTPPHSTKLPLLTWLHALFLVLTSSKGVSSVVLARQIGVTQPTAWKMGHAIRALMAAKHVLIEGLTGVVEADTKRVGGTPRRQEGTQNPSGRGSKKPIVLVATARGGQVRAAVIPNESKEAVESVLKAFVDATAHLMSDGDRTLVSLGKDFAAHETVNHGQHEYVRDAVHSNTADRFGDALERMKIGVFHHLSRDHLQRYVEEVCWHWNNRVQVKTRQSRGKLRRNWQPRVFLGQLTDLLRVAVGVQLRRSKNFGIRVVA